MKEYPESFELLYDRAMAAERIDRLDVAEADLRRVIKMKPDYAHAYNALGYTLAEKTDRLTEAKHADRAGGQALARRSVHPRQPRLGALPPGQPRGGAEASCRAPTDSAPDPEIAAHLGEVLWKIGQRDEARKIWRTALAENPEHETLLAVIQKFKP